MALLAVAIPIIPGKEEQWRRFIGELQTSRKADFEASRRRIGVRERTFSQMTPNGQVVIVTLEGDDPGSAFASFGAAQDEFTNWFVGQVEEIHGFNLRQPPPGPPPELVADSGSIE